MKLSIINFNQAILIESTRILFNLYLNEASPTWPASWADNIIASPKFLQWLQSLGIDGEIKQPMTGAVGRAYPIGDRHIIKFTTDQKEASAAKIISKYNSSHSAKIYDVRLVGAFQHPVKARGKVPLYVIAMERLNTNVGGKFRTAGTAIYSYLDHNSGPIESPKDAIRIIKSKYLNRKYQQDPAINYAIDKLVNSLYQLQQETGVLSQDPHGANLAFKNRNPAFFDFGRSSTSRPEADVGLL